MEEQTKVTSIGKSSHLHYISNVPAEENGLLHRREEIDAQEPGIWTTPGF